MFGISFQLHRPLINPIADKKIDRLSNVEEIDDEDQLNPDNIGQNKFRDNYPSYRKVNQRNYRVANRDNVERNENQFRQRQKIDNGEELDEGENRDEYRQLRKRNTV